MQHGPESTRSAQSDDGPAPRYYQWPGDDWHPEWGFNWEWALCHDGHHRDIDGDDRG